MNNGRKGVLCKTFLRPFCLQTIVRGNGRKECAAACLIVHLTAIMGYTVGNDEIVHAKNDVITCNLVEYVLCDLNIRGLVFYYHTRRKGRRIQNGVATLGCGVQRYAHFVGKQSGRIAKMIDKVMDKMLTYPFFGRQSDIFFPQHVEYIFFTTAVGYFESSGWQV